MDKEKLVKHSSKTSESLFYLIPINFTDFDETELSAPVTIIYWNNPYKLEGNINLYDPR